jgi:hypothetical protein
MGLEQNPTPDTAAPAPAPEASVAQKTGKLDWLKSLFGKNKSTMQKQDGPIPGVTPATDNELNASGPRVSLPAEQADINRTELNSAQKVA